MMFTGLIYHDLEDPENIRRCKQKLVEKNPEFASTDKKLVQAKGIKKTALEEWLYQ